jgi:hypothetical protein
MVVGVLALVQPLPAQAISLDFVPVAQSVELGDPVNVDVVIAGLHAEDPDQIVGAFDLDVTFDPAILAPTGVTFGLLLGDPALFEALTDFTLGSGLVDLAEVSLLDDATLDALQPDSFTLATLSFATVGTGTSQLAFVFDPFNDVKGLNAEPLTLDVGSGSVTVTQPSAPVPEPSSVVLVLLGVGALALLCRRIRLG